MDCYDQTHPLTPERPEKVTGPEVGALMRYVYGKPDHDWHGILVRVVERSYVWSPEKHNPDGTHGYRHYDWSVIEYKPSGKAMVVNDTDLTPFPLGTKVPEGGAIDS